MIAMSPGQARMVLDSAAFIIILCVLTYITARKNAHRNKDNYEKQFIKKLLIPMVISVLLVAIINVALNFFFSTSLAITLSAFLTDSNYWDIGIEEYLLENHYFLFPLSTLLQSILFAFFMILGYNSGCKKREKDRAAIMVNKQD
jgi:hypothetical protein